MVSTIKDIDVTKIANDGQGNINGTSKDDLIFMSGAGIGQAGDGNDIVYGGVYDDVIRGDGGNDLLYGGAGNDTLNGGIGEDILLGGEGNDTLFGGAGNDIMSGGDGADKFFLETGAGNDRIVDLSFSEGDTFTFAVGTLADMNNKQLTIASTSDLAALLARSDVSSTAVGNDLVISYGAGGDTLTLQGFGNPTSSTSNINGNGSANTIFGDEVGNRINGGDGDDVLFAGASGTQIAGGVANTGSTDDDLVVGGAGNDILGGQAGDDLIFGGAGADTIGGGKGNDILTGGSGNDTFNFVKGDGNDTITDFSAGDKINLYQNYVSGQAVVTVDSVQDLKDLVTAGHATVSFTNDSVSLHFDGGDSIRFIGIDWV